MRTLLSHFYNEEYLLPWWLEHHKKCFDNGILINYGSTDRSVEICKDICPHWKIVDSKNEWFDADKVDAEITRYEHEISGWKICLNTTEFLYGNYSHLNNSSKKLQYFIGSYVFVYDDDSDLTYDKCLHNQRTRGFFDEKNTDFSKLVRARRSIHNYNIEYPCQGGRHFGEKASFDDLVIFYYGYACSSENAIKRKTQIMNKIKKEDRPLRYDVDNGHPNMTDAKTFIAKIEKFVIPRSKQIPETVKRIVKIHENNYNAFLQ